MEELSLEIQLGLSPVRKFYGKLDIRRVITKGKEGKKEEIIKLEDFPMLQCR